MASERYTVELNGHGDSCVWKPDENLMAVCPNPADAETIAAALNTAAGVSELVEALRPFAAVVRDFDGYGDDYEVLAFGGRVLTAGDCRRAAEVLEKWEAGSAAQSD